MHLVLNAFARASDKNDLFVKRDVDNQKWKLKQRLEKRKVEAFMSNTINTQSSNLAKDTIEKRKNEAIFENFLDELDMETFGDEVIKEESYHTDGDSLSDHPSQSEKSYQSKSDINVRNSQNRGDGELNQAQRKSQEQILQVMSPKRKPGYFSPSSPSLSAHTNFISSPMGTKRFKLGNE